jgi:predicted regulator of Ras-like GTPase activity (Roadblock/LC7/MglB family)
VEPPVVQPPGAEPAGGRSPVDRFVERVPGVRQVLLVADDGLVAAAGGPMGRDDLERVAAGVSGIRRAGHYLAAVGDTEVRCIIADSDEGTLLATPIEDGPCLTVFASTEADLGLVAYETAQLADIIRGRMPSSAPRPALGVKGADDTRPGRSALDWLLDDLVNRTGGGEIVSCVAASVDGIALAGSSNLPFRAGPAAAAAASLFSGCGSVSTRAYGGRLRQVVAETRRGYCMVTPLGPGAVLLQFLDSRADLGFRGYEALMLGERVGQAFDQRALMGSGGPP